MVAWWTGAGPGECAGPQVHAHGRRHWPPHRGPRRLWDDGGRHPLQENGLYIEILSFFWSIIDICMYVRNDIFKLLTNRSDNFGE